MIGAFCRERGIFNTSLSKNPLQRHPYEPSYLFEACMKPWIGFPLKGAIWYQGEANVHNADLHDLLFASLIKSWRKYWGNGFPVYFAQLSSFQNPSWPHFRNRQRLLMENIPGTGMVVTSDLGDLNDIHPKRKKEVGERLALWALANEYGMDVTHSGPLFVDADVQEGKVIVRFKFGENLRLSGGETLMSFEVAGKDKVFKTATAMIDGSRVVVRSEEIAEPAYVRYGWKPFSDGNLVNGAGLPASTFLAPLNRRTK